MIVTAMAEGVIEAQILAVIHTGRRTFIRRISLDASISTGLRFIRCRRQAFIRLGVVISIKKVQGESFDRVGAYLNNHVFQTASYLSPYHDVLTLEIFIFLCL
jgi:hypothetical protein